MSSLTSRAAKHAALADPTRLMIVNALTLGDASPSELQYRLGMASNLMAHHLKVLEAEGILRRGRSEGDRRRTYLQLVAFSFEGLVPAVWVSPVARIVFVCTANTARSQLAARLWKDASPVPVVSAGTHPGDRTDPGAIAVARRHGLPLRATRPRAVGEVVAPDDVVITVCDSAHEALADPAAIHWSVPDPVPAKTDAAFDAAFAELSNRVDDLALRVTSST